MNYVFKWESTKKLHFFSHIYVYIRDFLKNVFWTFSVNFVYRRVSQYVVYAYSSFFQHPSPSVRGVKSCRRRTCFVRWFLAKLRAENCDLYANSVRNQTFPHVVHSSQTLNHFRRTQRPSRCARPSCYCVTVLCSNTAWLWNRFRVISYRNGFSKRVPNAYRESFAIDWLSNRWFHWFCPTLLIDISQLCEHTTVVLQRLSKSCTKTVDRLLELHPK